MMSYAEDETDVEGTVNGVTNTASGERLELALLPHGVGVGVQSASWGLLGRKVYLGRSPQDSVSGQLAKCVTLEIVLV